MGEGKPEIQKDYERAKELKKQGKDDSEEYAQLIARMHAYIGKNY